MRRSKHFGAFLFYSIGKIELETLNSQFSIQHSQFTYDI